MKDLATRIQLYAESAARDAKEISDGNGLEELPKIIERMRGTLAVIEALYWELEGKP